MPTFPLANLNWPELLIIGLIALLIFGKRLPEVARSLGKGMTEFKKGLRGIEDDAEAGLSRSSPSAHKELPTPKAPEQTIEPAAEKQPVREGAADGEG